MCGCVCVCVCMCLLQAQETAYNILMEYLNLVLFEKRNFEKQAPLVSFNHYVIMM